MDVKTEAGETVAVRFLSTTVLQRVAPGEKDLENATSIQLGEIKTGDRVLVTFVPETSDAHRIVVMSAGDIAQKREADRKDWMQRGVSGVVTSRKDDQITLRLRSFQGESTAVVKVSAKTSFKRYAPDSVKFSDAVPGAINQVSPGDQLRARGQKSDDGLTVIAGEVVFGTFQTRAGEVTAIDAAAGEVTIKDLITHKPVVIKLTADSQMKRMPDLAGPGAGFGRTGAGGGMGPAGAGMPGGRPGGPPDFSTMLERMPAARLVDLKPGETLVVSSTKTAQSGRLTAIMLLANAGRLIEMASRQNGDRSAGPGLGGMSGMGMSGLGAGGLELPAMLP